MAIQNRGFCDLSVDRNFDLTKLQNFEKLGYKTIALNTFVPEKNEEPVKKKKKGDKKSADTKEKQDPVPPPVEITNEITINLKLNILQRITIEFSDPVVIHNLTKSRSENFKKYDIIAAYPTTLNAFQYACSTMDVDIITFSPETRLPFKIPRKMYGLAVERRVFFELMYGPAIIDSTARKNIINTSHYYHTLGKSKNILICSAAVNHTQVRDVHDVTNLGFILGLDNVKALEAIRRNPQTVIQRALSRKCGKYYIEVNIVSKDGENKIMEE